MALTWLKPWRMKPRTSSLSTKSPSAEELAHRVDCQTFVGSAVSPEALNHLGIRSTDIVVAVTGNDTVNMVVCQLADHFRVPQKFARVRNPEFLQQTLGAE